jgi:hypothetical protein
LYDQPGKQIRLNYICTLTEIEFRLESREFTSLEDVGMVLGRQPFEDGVFHRSVIASAILILD